MTGLLLIGCFLAAAPERDPTPPLSDVEAAHRDALARFAVGQLKAHKNLPVQAVKELETAAKADADSPGPLRPLVRLYGDLGRHAAAIRTARKVLELDPDDAETGHQLGLLLYEGNKFADAVTILSKAAASPRLADSPARRLGVLRDLARAAEKANSAAVESDTLLQALRLLTEHHDALLRGGQFANERDFQILAARLRESLGQALIRQKKFPEATAAFREASQSYLDPAKANEPNAAARLDWNLAEVLRAEGKTQESLEHLEKFLAKKPSTIAPYEQYADLLRHLGRGRDTPALLAALASANESNEGIRWIVAVELYRQNPTAGMAQFRDRMMQTTDIRFFDRMVAAIADGGGWSDLLQLCDTIYTAAQPPKDEVERTPEFLNAVERARSLTAAIKSQPKRTAPLLRHATRDAETNRNHELETWELLANLAERDGQLPQAETMLRAAANGRGDTKKLAHQLFDVLYKQRKWTELATEAQQHIRENQNNNRSLGVDVLLATAHAETGNADAALNALKSLANVTAEGQVWAKTRTPYILNILGRHPQAVVECKKLLDTYPKPEDQRQIRLVLSDAYLNLKDYAKAEEQLRFLLDRDPDDTLVLNNLGYNLADQGRCLDEAEAMIRRAIEIDADSRLRNGDAEAENGTYLDSLGWVLQKRGKLTEARDLLERCVKMPDGASSGEEWDHLGDVRFRTGDRIGARAAWEKSADLLKNTHRGRGRLDDVQKKLRQIK